MLSRRSTFTEKKKGSGPLSGRIKGLDLAAARPKDPISALAKKVEEYTQRTNEVLWFPPSLKSIPDYSPHNITLTNSNNVKCETMRDLLLPDIKAFVNEVDYNGLNTVTSFLDFYDKKHKEEPSKSIFKIFNEFQPDSKDEAVRTHGTNCVGKAQEFAKRIESKYGMKAHVIVESGGPTDPPTHAAVVVPCKDGILLVEVDQLSDNLMTILKPNVPLSKFYPGDGFSGKQLPGKGLTASIEIVETPGNYKTPTPLIVKKEIYKREVPKKIDTYRQFVLRTDQNPDQSVMKRWLIKTDFFPVSTGAREGKEQYSLQVNIAYKKITFNIGKKKFRLPLSAFKNGAIDKSKLSVDKGQKITQEEMEFLFGKEGEIGGEFFNQFKTGKKLLLEQIFKVVEHENELHLLLKR